MRFKLLERRLPPGTGRRRFLRREVYRALDRTSRRVSPLFPPMGHDATNLPRHGVIGGALGFISRTYRRQPQEAARRIDLRRLSRRARSDGGLRGGRPRARCRHAPRDFRAGPICPVICEEFAIANFQLQMGRPRHDVLRDLGTRTGVDDVRHSPR